MAKGQVIVNALNLVQGTLPSVERHFLFIGPAPSGQDAVTSVDQQTDLDDAFGSADSVLKTNLIAARLNASDDFSCSAVAIAAADWAAAVDLAVAAGISPEAIVVLVPMATDTAVNAMQAKAVELLNTYARRVFFIGTVAGIDPLTETWAQYQTALDAIIDGVAANRVGLVPQLHGNDAGVIAGRLCNSAASIADSPMRVATGALVGLGDTPVDSDDKALSSAVLSALETLKYSVPQSYVDYPGVYWTDFNLLDIPGGDYQVVENLRVVDKAARAVRLLAIARVANRMLNNSNISIAQHKTYFARPLRDMSRSAMVDGVLFPAELQPPADDAVNIVWTTQTAVQVYLKLTPFNSPKQIIVNIYLDLSGGDL